LQLSHVQLCPCRRSLFLENGLPKLLIVMVAPNSVFVPIVTRSTSAPNFVSNLRKISNLLKSVVKN